MRINPVLGAGALQALFKLVHVRAAIIAKVIDRSRRALSNAAAAFVLAVENAERIRFETCAAAIAKLGLVCAEICDELLPVFRSALGAADRIYMKRGILYAELLYKRIRHGYDREIRRRVRCAEHLGSELIEFAASRLRLLVAEAVYYVEQAKRHRIRALAVLDDGADNSRRSLGTERESSALSVLKGIHLLLYDVGRLADAAGKQPELLECRRSYFRIAEIPGYRPRRILYFSPRRDFRRSNIRGSSRSAYFLHRRDLTFLLRKTHIRGIFSAECVFPLFSDITVYQTERIKSSMSRNYPPFLFYFSLLH